MNHTRTPTFKSREAYISHVANHREPIEDKNAMIVRMCTGKTVLDMGCIDHSYSTALGLGDRWLHKQIKAVAASLTGLDILQEDALELNRLGYDIRIANAEQFDFGEKFDVIVAGDLIEHLSNIGMFLQSVKRHMHAESLFIISTPNPFNVEQAISAVFANSINVHPQHTVWLSPQVCWELVSREHLSIAEFHWIDTRFSFYLNKPFWRLFMNKLAKWIIRTKPICRRDFAVVLALQQEATSQP